MPNAPARILALAFAAAFLAAPALPAATGLPNVPLPLVKFETVADGLVLPLAIVNAGDGSERLFVLEQRGTVRVIEDGELAAGFWMDIRSRIASGGERGLLGLAFHPDFESNGILFASYTNKDGDSVLERFVVPNPATGSPDLGSGHVILTVDQPYSNHNGGTIAFGRDGYLYFGLGDGGSGGDPQGHGQNVNTLLGAMLRLDVDVPTGYAIPADNPFANGGGRAEIWSYGLRNPWKFSFDRDTGDMWIGDVGQNLVEEIDYEPFGTPGGRNYGWNQFEGSLPYKLNANPAGKTFPVLEYFHTGHCSVTGGYVYRGSAIPELAGSYLYADYCSGSVWAARGVGELGWQGIQIGTSISIAGFGEDEAGELYFTRHSSALGAVLKIVPAA